MVRKVQSNTSHASSTGGLPFIIAMHLIDGQRNTQQAYPQENVGVFVQRGRGGPLSVVEYSEMDAAMTTEINQSTGRLRYCWSNVWLYHLLLAPLPSFLHLKHKRNNIFSLSSSCRSACICSLWTFWTKWQTVLKRTVCEYSLVCLLNTFQNPSVKNRVENHISYLVANMDF